MANYEKASPADDWTLKLAGERLGKPIGRYRNPGPEGEVVGIFADGLAWDVGGRSVEVRFTDVSEVTLPSGKESKGLLLKIQGGEELQLPIKGQRGRFSDSVEMLRFLDRVLQDLRSTRIA